MFIAIMAHKWAESMTIGISFAKALSDVGYQQTYIILFIFSCATPLGTGIGISLSMVNALVKANKQFDLFIYPDKNHSIYGGKTRLHLFTQITDFITKNLEKAKKLY